MSVLDDISSEVYAAMVANGKRPQELRLSQALWWQIAQQLGEFDLMPKFPEGAMLFGMRLVRDDSQPFRVVAE